jgi:hypothetical protein
LAIIRSDNGERFISAYTSGELTPETVVRQCKKIKDVFPALTQNFFDVFIDRVKEKNFTDQRLIDAINHVIDTCQYPTPAMANFLSYDQKKRLYTYNEVCEIVSKGDNWNYFKMIEINNLKWWIKNDINI